MSDDLLFERASRYGDRIAIVDRSANYRYRDLLAFSDRVAGALQSIPRQSPEARVAFLVEPGFEHVAIQWGIWRAGLIAVPLALSHPPRELEYVLDDATPSTVIASPGEFTERIRPLAQTRGLPFLTAPLPSVPLTAPKPSPSGRAMMIYTSGTTGRPKGVVTTHANIRAQVATLSEAWGWRPDDRSLHVLPLHHVHGIINGLSCALWSGASVEFLHPFEPIAAWDRLASGEITFFTAVPTVYARLVATWEAADDRTRRRWSDGARKLRLMLSGSAALPVGTLNRWEEITGHRLLERYGMTEIGMALSNPLVGERRPGTVGTPLPDVSVRIMGENGAQVAHPEPGHLEVRGPQVFAEYWNRPEETARSFRDGWFLTGDVGALENGYYRLLGRQSVDIIKSAGYKISALEIEEVLREHPEIVDCAVVGLADDELGEKIAAAVAGKVSIEGDALRSWLKERLAPYKIPRSFLRVDDLPRNAMGKVTKTDVKALFSA